MFSSTIFVASAFLFCIGFIGVFRQYDIVMILASVLNFCFLGNGSGELPALIAVILSGITISVVYAIYTKQLKEENIEFLSED